MEICKQIIACKNYLQLNIVDKAEFYKYKIYLSFGDDFMRADKGNTTYISFLPNEYDNPFHNEKIVNLHHFLKSPIDFEWNDGIVNEYKEIFFEQIKSLLGDELQKKTMFIIPFEWNLYSRNLLKEIVLEVGSESNFLFITDILLLALVLSSIQDIQDGYLTFIYNKKEIGGFLVRFAKKGNHLELISVYRRKNPLKMYFQNNMVSRLFVWGNLITAKLENTELNFQLLDAFSLLKSSEYLENLNSQVFLKTRPFLCLSKEILDERFEIKAPFPLYFPLSFQVKDICSDTFVIELFGGFCEEMDLLQLAKVEVNYNSGLGRIEESNEFIINIIIEVLDGRTSTFNINYIDYNGKKVEKRAYFDVPSIAL